MEGNSDYRGEIVIFRNEDGEVNVQIDAVNETIWATQKSMAELFGVDVRTISYHLKSIFQDKELSEESVLQKKLDNCYRWEKLSDINVQP